MDGSPRPSSSRGMSRRALLQAGAATTLVALAGPVARGVAGGAPKPGGFDSLFTIRPAAINAYTGGSPLTPPVLQATDTQTVAQVDPALIDLFARTNQLVATMLDTKSDVLLLPAEAILALEAAFRSLTRPGMVALNLVSGIYGDGYREWLETYGATVIEIRVPYNQSIDPASVATVLAQHPEVELMSVVHVDTPSGTKNDIEKICPIAKQHGVVTIVDAASTIGGMPVYPDAWGVDVAIGASQKCVGSPQGVGITTVSEDAWKLIAKNPDAPPDFSFLNLSVFKETMQTRVPSTVSPTVTYGLYEALAQLLDRGMDQVFASTALAGRAFRAGAVAMGIKLWAADESIASDTNTTLVTPSGIDLPTFVTQLRDRYGVVGSSTAFTGSPSGNTIRVGHMGPIQTDPQFVLTLLEAIGRGWQGAGAKVDIRAGLQAARRAFS
jgi:pyridoxamine---pyruvate transaminase